MSMFVCGCLPLQPIRNYCPNTIKPRSPLPFPPNKDQLLILDIDTAIPLVSVTTLDIDTAIPLESVTILDRGTAIPLESVIILGRSIDSVFGYVIILDNTTVSIFDQLQLFPSVQML